MARRLYALREEELAAIKSNAMIGNIAGVTYNATPVLATLLTFTLYATAGNEMSAATCFTALSLFSILRFPLNAMPNTIQRVIDINVTMKRLGAFMLATESHPRLLGPAEAPDAFDGYFRCEARAAPAAAVGEGGGEAGGEAEAEAEEGKGQLAVEVMDCDFKWPEPAGRPEARVAAAEQRGLKRLLLGRGAAPATPSVMMPSDEGSDGTLPTGAEHRPTLAGVNLRVRPGDLLGISGPVGSGKTSLLLALLNELPRLRGRVVLRGRVAFCAQVCVSPASPLHLPCISPASPLHLPCVSPASPLHLLHLPCISPASPLHLPPTSPVTHL